MVSLTVADLSGMIAAGVFLLQLIPPIILPAILIAFITNKNSIVTWSVLGRLLHSSYWPSILRTETAASSGVGRPVLVTGYVQNAVRVLLWLASIVTPLGLYESIEPAKSQTDTGFVYLPDRSAFGYGTPSRTNASFTRICGQGACPGSSMSQNCSTEGFATICNSTVDIRMPIELRDLLVSGAANFSPSVSSVFDMQWRTYVNLDSGQGSTTGEFIVGKVRPLSVLVLDESIQLVEGLIVDMVSGGIGFRNHTGPAASSGYGSTWQEDILFVEPETQCANLNVTLDFDIDYGNGSNLPTIVNQVLTDRGGFSQMQPSAPSLSSATNGQGDLLLWDRAYRAAWLNNFYTLAYFNATDPNPSNITRLDMTGQTFELSSDVNFTVFQAIRTTTDYGEYLVFDQSNTTRSSNSVGEENFIAIILLISTRWAVESLADSTISDAQPTWGIVGTSNSSLVDPSASTYNMSTLVSERLYLPGYIDQYYPLLNGAKGITDSQQNLPGVDFYRQSLYEALTVVALGTRGIRVNCQITLARPASHFLAANTVVGTKGWGLTAASLENSTLFLTNASLPTDQSAAGLSSTSQVPVTLYQRHICYRLPYSIPAIIVLATILCILSTLLVFLGRRRTGSTKMRQLIDGTASGRIMALLLWPKEGEMTGIEWIRNVRKRQVRVTSDGVFPEDDGVLHDSSNEAVTSKEEPDVDETTPLDDHPDQEEQEDGR
ncbi:hypothetical protein DPV78_008163 [Talaromyces pinophilus]|nr:hypothetical protein DPV78_008163 [Talaromyces pinophilus]